MKTWTQFVNESLGALERARLCGLMRAEMQGRRGRVCLFGPPGGKSTVLEVVKALRPGAGEGWTEVNDESAVPDGACAVRFRGIPPAKMTPHLAEHFKGRIAEVKDWIR